MNQSRQDIWIPDYAINVPVTAGTLWTGPIIDLSGGAGFRCMYILSGGAAGSIGMYVSDFDPNGPLATAAGYPPQVGALGITATANQANVLTAANNAPQAYARCAWGYFSPSASGTMSMAITVRRYPTA